MSWHVYKKDDPSTWPEIDCPVLIYKENFNSFHIWRWKKSVNKFITNDTEREINYTNECYYQYIGYVPNGYTTFKTKKCSAYPEKLCEYVDDGYCFDAPEGMSCEFCQEVNEYSLNDNLRIWKEFEQ